MCKLKVSNKILLSGTSPGFKIIPTTCTTPYTSGGEEKREVCIIYLDFGICCTSYQVFTDFPIRECNDIAAVLLTLVLGAGRWWQGNCFMKMKKELCRVRGGGGAGDLGRLASSCPAQGADCPFRPQYRFARFDNWPLHDTRFIYFSYELCPPSVWFGHAHWAKPTIKSARSTIL